MYQPFDRQQHFFTRVFEIMKTPSLSETGMIVAAKKVKFNFHVAVEKLDLQRVSFSFFFFFDWWDHLGVWSFLPYSKKIVGFHNPRWTLSTHSRAQTVPFKQNFAWRRREENLE